MPFTMINNPIELAKYYRCHPLCRKVVDYTPNLMGSAWGMPQTDKENILDLLKDKLELLRGLYCSAQKTANLYGGAVIVRYVDDGLDWSEPIDLTRINKIEYSRAYDRYDGISPTLDFDDWYNSDYDYHHPKYYHYGINNQHSENTTKYYIHESRVIRFRGLYLPQRLLRANQGWEDSLLGAFLERYKLYDDSLKSVGKVIRSSSIPIIKKQGLLTQIAQSLKAMMQGMKAEADEILSKFGVDNPIWIDSEKMELEFKERSLANFDSVMELIVDDLVASSGLTKPQLFGIHPTGLSATGESEKRTEAQIVASLQDYLWGENINYDLDLLLAEAKITESIDWEWNSSYELPPLEQVELDLKNKQLLKQENERNTAGNNTEIIN